MEKDKPEFGESEANDTWTVIGSASDKLMADYVLDALRSDGIGAVLRNRSGYFGDVGLTLTSVFGSGEGAYEILTPAHQAGDALEIAEMVGGDSWESTTKKEN